MNIDKQEDETNKKQINDEYERIKKIIYISMDHSRDIYLREQIDGKWQAVRLADLPVERVAHWLATWIVEGRR